VVGIPPVVDFISLGWRQHNMRALGLPVEKLTFRVRFGTKSRRIGGVLGSTVFSQFQTFVDGPVVVTNEA